MYGEKIATSATERKEIGGRLCEGEREKEREGKPEGSVVAVL